MSTLSLAQPAPRNLASRVTPFEALRHGATLAWRNVMQLRHSPEKLADTVLMPIVFLILFLYVFGGAIAGSTHAYLQILLPGLAAQMTMFATMGLGVAINEDIHKGIFDRFRSLPIARSAPLIGSLLGNTIRFGLTMVILFGLGSLLGFRFEAGPASILAALALAYVFYLAFSCLSLLVGLSAPSPEAVQGFSFIVSMPLTFGSSVFMADTSSMPGWLEAWVTINPVTQLADSMRALMLGTPLGDHAWYALAWALGLMLVTFPVALKLYGRRV
jgi:oleandomycin transport system permease protein